MENTNLIEHAEYDPFSEKIKSSVKLIKNSKGINWEIRIVSGEDHLIDGLMKKAIETHKELINELIKIKEAKE